MDIKHVAKLANLPLTADEEKRFSAQLTAILNLVSQLQKVPTKNVVPTSQVTGQENVFRDDKIETERILTQDEALSNAKKTYNGYFVVPRIFKNDH
ncbi:MAG: Asp-tRNA(Asn)/Glu-tRNA(Gln) amidotransferase subunit GatC [Patescibacteria group bacterium]|nr:Asp-tRNA(Asn)/Glu-tRNA(Gln) amidotransferase subunit GatC [Patescibacteria group bacterium]MCL5432328.1 Asp-tRNA(Asn)/Glu-tRNA(Gln) amidotransferase subunit GatC [Patescibacteria group bacterium]